MLVGYVTANGRPVAEAAVVLRGGAETTTNDFGVFQQQISVFPADPPK
jgi:hypothetical protein